MDLILDMFIESRKRINEIVEEFELDEMDIVRRLYYHNLGYLIYLEEVDRLYKIDGLIVKAYNLTRRDLVEEGYLISYGNGF